MVTTNSALNGLTKKSIIPAIIKMAIANLIEIENSL
jgi:hypothetical protein